MLLKIKICFLLFSLPILTIAQNHVENGLIHQFSDKDLLQWDAYGIGARHLDHGQLLMTESNNSKGYMLVSPKSYGKDVRVSYDIMAMNAATVLVVELLAHNDDYFGLTFDESYDGNVKYMFHNLNMYMFAFHNESHNKTGPFVRKWPKPGKEPLVIATSNVVQTGKYHHVELGIENGILFYEIDGKKIWSVKDDTPYEGGKIILRIRGTGPIKGGCLIRGLQIEGKELNN
jgi:hypothetical protein